MNPSVHSLVGLTLVPDGAMTWAGSSSCDLGSSGLCFDDLSPHQPRLNKLLLRTRDVIFQVHTLDLSLVFPRGKIHQHSAPKIVVVSRHLSARNGCF